jgi:alpha-tubulin suppressor-like RCC1 family protein
MIATSCGPRARARSCGLALFALGALLCSTVQAHAQGYGVRAWGENSDGMLGIGATSSFSAMPVRVKASPGGDALTNVVQVAAGQAHTIALKADGTVWAWGSNNYGQLGNGTTTPTLYPVQVMRAAGTPLTGVSSIASGAFSCYAVVGTTVYAWGNDEFAQLGNTSLGITSQATTYPVTVSLPSPSGLTGVTVVAGYGYALALQTVREGIIPHLTFVRTLYAWGGNTNGQLGQGTSGAASATPVVVTLSGTSAVAVSAGDYHCLAIDASGNVWAWGSNLSGESGSSTSGNITTPTQVSGISDAVQVSGGDYASYCICGSSPVLYAWGDNLSGQLGLGSITTSATLNGGISTPTEVSINAPSGVTISSVAASYGCAYVLMSNGTVYASGANNYGELGSGDFGTPLETVSPSFQLVQNLTGATSVAVSSVSFFALTNDFKFVWQDTLTGIAPYWDFGSATSIANTYQGYIGYFLNTGYSIVAAVDLFQDGNRSLILQNNSTGALAYLRLNGTNVVAGGLIPAAPSYSASEVVVGTMNINGSPAIVWQNKSTGEVDYWTMGLQTINGVVTPVSTGGGKIVAPGSYTWQVAAAYPAGGENWIIWHDISSDSTAGELVYQQVGTNGAYIANSGRVYQSTVPAGWSLHVEDVNGDGNPDFIWHDTNGSSDPQSGETFIWLMNGPSPTFKSSQQVSGLASGQVSIPIDYYIGAIL